MQRITINNKKIEYRLEPWYTLWQAYLDYIAKGIKNWKTHWFFYWTSKKNKVWKWRLDRNYRDYVIEAIDNNY